MRTEANAIRGHEIVLPHLDLDAVREWAKRVFTKDRIVAVALFGATLTALGVLFFVLYGAIQTNTIAAPSPYLSSFNWQFSIPAY